MVVLIIATLHCIALHYNIASFAEPNVVKHVGVHHMDTELHVTSSPLRPSFPYPGTSVHSDLFTPGPVVKVA